MFLLSLLAMPLWGQEYSLSGKVFESDTKAPLEYATISLEINGKIVSGGVTNEKGEFEIKAPKGNYHLKVQFFSFKNYEVKNFNLNANKKLPPVYLDLDIEELTGVEVTAQRTTVELHLDKKVYNVGQDMTVKGGSVSDVLDNVPSVSVDAEGKVSFRGNESVQILINGKPSALSGVNDEALRQLPAESIERVEVISNPSSRYQAEGTAGIINIILKKGSTMGFMGSVTASVGSPQAYELGTNLSLRKQDWMFFTNISLNKRKSPGSTLINQSNLNDLGQVLNYQDEFRKNYRLRKGLNLNFGAEYRFNDQSSITNSIVYGLSDGENTSDVDFYNYDMHRNLTAQRYRSNIEKEDDKRFQYSFNFEHKFDNEGHKLTADYQFSRSTEEGDGIIEERNLTANTRLFPEQTLGNEKERKHLVQLDYVLPFGKNKKSQFEAGYRGTLDETDINYVVGDLDTNGNLIVNNNYTNHFVYDQHVNAIYSQLGTKFGKWNFMGGLRYEHTQVTSLLKNTNENYSKSYGGLFPSVYLGYEFSESQQVSVSYSRRLRRPHSRFINPFVRRSSNTNLFSGNPDIDPTFTNAFDVSYLKRWDKISLNTSIYYNHSTEVFEMISLETGDFITINGLSVPVMLRRPINLSDEDRVGAEFTANYTPKQNWRFSLNMNFYHYKSNGSYSYTNYLGNSVLQEFNTEANSWSARFTAKFPLIYKVDFQTNVMYNAPRKSAQSDIEGNLSANLALSREILNKKGTISLNVSDLFNSRKMIGNTITERVISHSEMQWRQRQIMLNFTYRFGNMKGQQKEKERKQQQRSMDDGGEMEF
ncbi:TonB-dependent receptor [Capnocytophaga sp.]|uniref:TonB-dependent receptor domain-containing protein n=1 Tax=Capnocytophaga sp. TaxID=44737 RepID=UPI0026DD208A|nr:TonB-dependent receptor [Capnocytophaga sp.]